MDRDWDLSLYVSKRYLWALSVIQHHKKLARKVIKELVTRWCITEWVKRLAGNEIELGIEIPMIESRASNIPIVTSLVLACPMPASIWASCLNFWNLNWGIGSLKTLNKEGQETLKLQSVNPKCPRNSSDNFGKSYKSNQNCGTFLRNYWALILNQYFIWIWSYIHNI